MPDKIIKSIEQTDLKHAESARTQFYSGIIVPDIYNQPVSSVKLVNIAHENLSPDQFEVVDVYGLGYARLLMIIKDLQIKHNLYGNAFLDFWDKISVNAARQNGEDYSITPGNRIRVINLRGFDPETFAISDVSKIFLTERNLLL